MHEGLIEVCHSPKTCFPSTLCLQPTKLSTIAFVIESARALPEITKSPSVGSCGLFTPKTICITFCLSVIPDIEIMENFNIPLLICLSFTLKNEGVKSFSNFANVNNSLSHSTAKSPAPR